MKYVLTRIGRGTGMYYFYYGGEKIESIWILAGTNKLSKAFIFKTADSALKMLQDNKQLQKYGYYIRIIQDKELFEARLKDK